MVIYLDRTTLRERQEALQRQLRTYYKTLNRLEEQRAQYGLRVPVDLANELDEIRTQIGRAEEELERVTEQLESLPEEPAGATGDRGPGTGSVEPDSTGPGEVGSAQELAPLAEALARRSLVLFVGADLPAEVTGLPSRADLAQELARRKGLDESLSLAEVAQRVSQAGNRFEFTDFLRNALDTVGKPPRPLHQAVVRLLQQYRLETLITTAYDNLLELACQQAGLGINRVVRGSDVNFINPDRPSLIRLYGDLQQPDTLVVTDRDHSDLLRDREREALLDEVKQAFRRNTVLFLGYNLADADFRFIFDQVAGSRFARAAYAVWPSLPATNAQMWRDRGIAILGTEPLAVLQQLLH